MNTVKKTIVTQFDLTNNILNNLSQYDLTPTAKLVLLYLTTCYNPKHADVFPKQKTIADKIGVSERSVIRAVQELFKAGLILIECKHTNRYKLMLNSTSQLSQNDKLSLTECQNVTFTPDNLSPTCNEQIKEQKKQQRGLNKLGGNVYSGDDAILYDYAKKRANKSVDAYIKKLKESKSAEKIIAEYKKKTPAFCFKQTDLLREKREQEKQERVMPEECAAWVQIGKKFGIKK